jgi:hypothetical protein
MIRHGYATAPPGGFRLKRISASETASTGASPPNSNTIRGGTTASGVQPLISEYEDSDEMAPWLPHCLVTGLTSFYATLGAG